VEAMAQEKKDNTTGILSSKYRRASLVIIAALFTFGGPYMAYVLNNVLKMRYSVSTASGFVLFIIGLVLIWYLIRNKVIS
jgi:hypothetical protein